MVSSTRPKRWLRPIRNISMVKQPSDFMEYPKYNKIIFFISLGGLLFSGYLSAVKLLTSTCAFDETCPYFLGYPTCFYGFIMFLVIFLASLLGMSKNARKEKITLVHVVVSIIGIMFAGYFVAHEINLNVGDSVLGLPTCVYGFIFYVAIFVFSIKQFAKNKGY